MYLIKLIESGQIFKCQLLQYSGLKDSQAQNVYFIFVGQVMSAYISIWFFDYPTLGLSVDLFSQSHLVV